MALGKPLIFYSTAWNVSTHPEWIKTAVGKILVGDNGKK